MKKITLLLITILMTGCFHDPYKKPDDVYFKLNTLEIYNNYKISELVKDTNVLIENKNDKIFPKSFDNNHAEIKYTYKKKNYIYKVTYKAKDSVPPQFLEYRKSTTLLINKDRNLCDINRIDNASKKVKCEIVGEYDIKKVGVYDIEYVIRDDSGNINTYKSKVYVVNNLPKTNKKDHKEKKIYFKDVYKEHKNDNSMIGIDISKWQGEVDFSKVKEALCEFVMIRLGVEVDGRLVKDRYFDRNIKEAKNNNLLVGVYVYTRVSTKTKLNEQIEWILKELNNIKLDMGVAFDFEEFNNFQKYNMSKYDINNLYDIFNSKLNKASYKTLLYGNKTALNNIWYEKNNIWLAHYTDKTNYDKKYNMWQITQNGVIDGIKSPVDIDIYYKKKTNN